MEVMNTETYLEIAQFARELRINAVKMTHNGNSSHVGSVLSVADILAVLYRHILKINPQKPNLKFLHIWFELYYVYTLGLKVTWHSENFLMRQKREHHLGGRFF